VGARESLAHLEPVERVAQPQLVWVILNILEVLGRVGILVDTLAYLMVAEAEVVREAMELVEMRLHILADRGRLEVGMVEMVRLLYRRVLVMRALLRLVVEVEVWIFLTLLVQVVRVVLVRRGVVF
jgi:hypothetical protein